MFRYQWKTGAESLNEGVQNLMERLMRQKIADQEAAYKNESLGLEKELLPYKKGLLGAQTLEAQSKGEESLRKLEIIARAYGYKPPSQKENVSTESSAVTPSLSLPTGNKTYNYGGSQSDQETDANISANSGSYNPNSGQVAPQNANPENTIANNNQQNDAQKAKEIAQALGWIKETPAEQQQREVSTTRQTESDKNYIKKINDLETTAEAGMAQQPSADQLAKITSNPEFAKMMQNEYAPSLNFAYYNTFGTKAQKELLGEFKIYSDKLLTDSIHQFGSRFTNADLGFLLRQKITENDSLPRAQGKLKAIMYMREFATKRSERAAELMQNSLDSGGKKISLIKAIKIADREMDGEKMRKKIDEQVKGSDKFTTFIAPDNKTRIRIPTDRVEEFLNSPESKDHKRIG